MQIKEVIDLKLQAEKDILAIIKNLQNETKLNITNCGLVHLYRFGYRQDEIVAISLEIKIE